MFQRLYASLAARATSLARFLNPSPQAWLLSTRLLLGVWGALFVAFLFVNVLPHFSVGKLIGLIALFAMLAFASASLCLIFEVVARIHRAFRIGLLLAVGPLLLVLLLTWGVAGALLAVAVAVSSLLLVVGGAAALLNRPAAVSRRRSRAAFAFVTGIILIGVSVFALIKPEPDPNPELAGYRLLGHTLKLPDPGKPGLYAVAYFTYGSGTDKRRPEFAAQTRFRTKAVDGSRLDKRWVGLDGWLRTHYWGFDATALPLQGRVWMPLAPATASRFPLVLLVHGNYEMEVPSDTGYAYLGELLASQGFIVVSIDENFLNGSLADFLNPFTFRFGAENKLRGWLLLEHLKAWQAWNGDSTHPLFGKIDMDHIALVGHSRGGEAVAIANALNDLDRDPDDATVAFDYHFNLRAIAAIAPAEGQYRLRSQPTPMRDTNYFVIQGSMDGDVTSFVGSAQYARASFSGSAKAFKASLYVKDANHTQFSTGWGRYDVWLPSKVLLDERPLLAPEAQRQILQVYLSAFLQATLNDKNEYRPLFQDSRNGADWLPSTYLINNYADSDTTWLANYAEDLDPTTGSTPGVRIRGEHLSIWREGAVDLKSSSTGAVAVTLGWDDRFSAQRGSYEIELSPVTQESGRNASLVFSASDAAISSLPDGLRRKGDAEARNALDWTLALIDANGREARLPLSHDSPLYPQLVGHTLRITSLNGTASSEIALRRYQFALTDFLSNNPKLDLDHLLKVRFEFDRSPRGAIVLTDVGLSQSR